MWFPTKERVLRQLTTLTADLIELEQQAEILAKRFAESDNLFGEFEELSAFRRELSGTTEGLMIAGSAVVSGRVSPRAMSRNLSMFRQQIEIYRHTVSGLLASVVAFGAV